MDDLHKLRVDLERLAIPIDDELRTELEAARDDALRREMGPVAYELSKLREALAQPAQPKQDKDWLTVKEAAEYLGVGQTTLRQLVADDKIKYHQRAKGCQIKFDRSWLDEYMTGLEPIEETPEPAKRRPYKPRGKHW